MMGSKNYLDFPYEFKLLNPENEPDFKDYIHGDEEEFVRVGPKNVYQAGIQTVLPKIYNMPLRSDDAFVATYPKSVNREHTDNDYMDLESWQSFDVYHEYKKIDNMNNLLNVRYVGTTLMQELVWLLLNNLDYQEAKSKQLNERFPFLELSGVLRTVNCSEEQVQLLKKLITSVSPEEFEEAPSPRFIKTHLPLSMLPPSLLDIAKVVYVARDPRDVAVSFYHHHKLMNMLKPNIEFKDYWKNFISDLVLWGPYFDNVLEAWEKRNHPNMLYLFYEDITKDLSRAIKRVADFFDKTLSEEEITKLAEHLHIDNFKNNDSVNMKSVQQNGLLGEGSFIRKGKAGGWRSYFDEEMTAEAEEWIAKHIRDTDFRFPQF